MKTRFMTALAVMTLSSMTFAQSTRFNVASLKIDKASSAVSVPTAVAKEIGIKIIEKCAALSPADSLRLESVIGKAGREDFKITATRTGADGSSRPISATVRQNLDVPFDREYDIRCDQRANVLADQSRIELEQLKYSKGAVDQSPVLTGASIQNVVVASKASDGSLILTETQALVVHYKTHSANGSLDSYEHAFGLQLNQMSPQFIAAATRAETNPNDLVMVVINKITQESATQVCAEKSTVNQGPQYPGDDGGPVEICTRYENQPLIQQLEGFRLAPRF